uniref:Putative secreted protein n=1 Tax=Anopheles darlingi TaxID=43151 RepID=A0A2M4D7G1_ANODA
MNFSSTLLVSMVCRATSNSAGVSGSSVLPNSAPTPSKRLNTSFTTPGFSLISFGKAFRISFFVSPLITGISKRTSDTFVW